MVLGSRQLNGSLIFTFNTYYCRFFTIQKNKIKEDTKLFKLVRNMRIMNEYYAYIPVEPSNIFLKRTARSQTLLNKFKYVQMGENTTFKGFLMFLLVSVGVPLHPNVYEPQQQQLQQN